MEAFIQIFIAIMIIKEHNSSTARVQFDPVMKFNHISLIKVESLTFWWSHRSVIWCESSREESKAGIVCMLRPLSCGWQFLLLHQFQTVSYCYLSSFFLLAFLPGETENESVCWENWSRRDIMVPIGLGDGGQESAPICRGRWGGGVCVCGEIDGGSIPSR